MVKFSIVATVVAGVISCGGIATADTVSANLSGDTTVGVNPGTTDMTVSFGPSTTFNSAYVGLINWSGATYSAGSVENFGTSFSTYCIEGTQDVYFGSNDTWTINALAHGVAAPDPASANGTFSDQQVNDLTTFWNRFYTASLSSNVTATAFQVGVWEIANDDSLTATSTAADYFNSGTFTAKSNSADDTAALNQAATWLDDVVSQGYESGNYAIYALTNPNAQDQLVALPTSSGGGQPPSTPLPAALPAGLSVMGCVGAAQWLRRRRQTAGV